MPYRQRSIDSTTLRPSESKHGRPRAYGERQRARIDTTLILGKLAGHIVGDDEMSATQIQAARILLDRTVPVLRAVEVQGNQEVRDVKTIRTADLLDAIEGEARRLK